VNWITGTSSSVPQQISALIAERLRMYVSERGRALLALPGGRSIARVAAYLAAEDLPWAGIHIFLVDERCVPVQDEQSNYQALRRGFFEPLLDGEFLPRDNVHLPQDTGRTNCDAEAYTHELARVARTEDPRFDIVLLGVGEDGHVASLFPNHPSIRERGRRYVISDDAPKAPPRRISATRELMETAATAVVLFLGEGKREAMRDFRRADTPVEERPCRLVYGIADAWAATDLA
jgi:6-phosphogluconolactonase